MMTKLHGNIRLLTSMELAEACKNNGPYFSSWHEGYGVMAEELEEASEEAELATTLFDSLLTLIRVGDKKRLRESLLHIEERATLAACEFVQVAAMAQKMLAIVKEDS